MSLHIYGNSAALTVEQDQTRDKYHTVSVEGTTTRNGAGWDWRSKTVFQLTREELPVSLAVLMGWREKAEFGHHGAERDKFLLLENRENRIFVALRQGDTKAAALGVTAADAFAWAMLALRQLQRNHGGISSDAVLAVCRETAGRL